MSTDAAPQVEVPQEILDAPVEEVQMRTRLLGNEIKVLKSEQMRLLHEQGVMKERIKDNADKISQNKVLPYLVGNVVEILDIDPDIDEDSEEVASGDAESRPHGKCAVIKTSTRQTIFLPLIGLVPPEQLEPVSYTHLTLPTNREV